MKTILITRPIQQSHSLAEALHSAGFNTVIFPTLLIVPAALESVGTLCFAHPTKSLDIDIAIFVSPATITPIIASTILAIGKGTAQALEKAGINVTAFANPANSETLLKHPLLQHISNKKIVIFCGENGKTLLQDTLTARGAYVNVIYTHQSIMPDYDEADLTWQASDIDVTVSTSLASLKNLRTMIEKYHRLEILQKPLVVISEAMKKVAPLLGFSNDILLADGADNGSILRMLL
jgi:uroporphyrinogen-III synthase